MSVDLNSIKHLVTRPGVGLPLGADHRYPISSVAQCACFLPHPPVQRHWQVFDHDTNRCRHLSRHVLGLFTWTLVSARQNICRLTLQVCKLSVASRGRGLLGRNRGPAYADVVKSATSHLL